MAIKLQSNTSAYSIHSYKLLETNFQKTRVLPPFFHEEPQNFLMIKVTSFNKSTVAVPTHNKTASKHLLHGGDLIQSKNLQASTIQ